MKLIIKNIRELVQTEETPVLKVSGDAMSKMNTIKNAWLKTKDDIITDFGSMDNWSGVDDWSDLQVIDADSGCVFPCWCDSHTHLVYADSRESEFVDRIKGLTYQQIAAKGGGILNSAKRLQETTEEDLLESALNRLNEVMRTGTGAVEIKSGYGLTTPAELKILRVIKKLKTLTPLTIKATFLGAHALPLEYKSDRKKYIDLIINEMLPAIRDEQLADFIDVFCETNYFSPEETDRILESGAGYGLKPKIHVNQFTAIGGIQAALKRNALSVDHLEVMRDEDFQSLLGSPAMPTLLPSCSFFLNIPYSPARRMIDAGLAVALSSDYNPGSSPSGNMCFVLSLACIKLKMTPEEAINAATINSAYAMGISDSHGSIAKGKKADFFITYPMPSYSCLPYAFGSNMIKTVVIGGNAKTLLV